MRTKRMALFLLFGSVGLVQAQQNLGIGTAEPHEATMLEIRSINRGVLIPRIALNENTVLKGGRNPLSALVFNNGLGDIKKRGFYFWTASQWELLALNSDVTAEISRVDQRIDEIKMPSLIVSEVAVPTNEVIDNKRVYIGRYAIEVVSPQHTSLPYNTTFKEPIVINNLSKVIQADIYDVTGELVLQNITAISTTSQGVSFYFGMKHMYTTLPTGRYQVQLKYLSTIAAN
ncbi:hypothetical protein [Myroides sp. DW712]|uniref:hypothetical protein n=1 Tax=Myroides sp. DW712 TaxID=3389800 RepID=UPI003979C870